MLVLLLRIGDQRYGLEAAGVQDVVPYVPLRAVPGAPRWIAGLLRHRDGIVPVVDLALLAGGAAAERLLSTRIILLRDRESERGDPIGVVAAGVTAVVRIDEASLRPLGVETPDAPWLGKIALESGDLLQLVSWKDLVPAEVRAALAIEVPA